MQVTVYRGSGSRQGPDIIDELLTAEQAGIARGRREINHSCSSRIREQASCPLHSFIQTGSLVAVTETAQRWPGMVRYCMLNLTLDGDTFTADMALHIEREEER